MNIWIAPPPPAEGAAEEVPASKRFDAAFSWVGTEAGTQFIDRTLVPGNGTVVEWAWNFGDGYGSKRQNPFHTFMCAGNYTVILQVVDALGNQGDVSTAVLIPQDRPLCGVLQRSEEGVSILTRLGWITIPQALFIALAALSGTSIAMGAEIPLVSMRIRWLVFAMSLALLAMSFGALSLVV
jgi:hypothetical protein